MEYPNAEQQAQVDSLLQVLESRKGGARHPIRATPLDMIAWAVFREAGIDWNTPLVVPDSVLGNALVAVCYRFDPPRDRSDALTAANQF